MTPRLDSAIKFLEEALKAEPDMDDCVKVDVCFFAEGHQLFFDRRNAKQLKRSGYSMRNIKGAFIR